MHQSDCSSLPNTSYFLDGANEGLSFPSFLCFSFPFPFLFPSLHFFLSTKSSTVKKLFLLDIPFINIP